jgi:tRNA threonylcarbamoyladenosine biosynthesis protein TsaE
VSLVLNLPNLDATFALGRRLGAALFPGAVLALIGPLGAGKTHLTRAIAEGLAIPDPRIVTSPTFVLMQEYPARLPMYHFDAYRLRNGDDFAELGTDELLAGDGVCLIEWADRVLDGLPDDHLRIVLEPTGETSRRVTLEATGPRHQVLVAGLTSTDLQGQPP